MTDRRVYVLGAALIAAGAAVLLALRPAAPGLAVVSYALAQAVVLHWGLTVYGAPGALAAAALAAFALPLSDPVDLGAAAGGVLAAYAIARCLLDPTVQWALALGGASLVAVALSAAPGIAATLVAYSLLMALVRTVTAERWERRGRVLQASLMAALFGWGVLAAATWAVAQLSHLPAVDDISAAARAVQVAAAPAAERTAAAAWRQWPLVPLLLAALRPWRAERRYSDAAWLLALLCVALLGGHPGAAVPLLALLAGAWWGTGRPAWMRRTASALVLLQVALATVVALAARQPAQAPPPAVRST